MLATTEIHKVPATIVSRTQRFDFKKASIADLVQRLEFVCKDNNIKASKEALITIAAAADGDRELLGRRQAPAAAHSSASARRWRS